MSRSSTAGFDKYIAVFSPEGRLYQVEYAFKPILNSNITAVAIRGVDSVVIVCEKKVQDKLIDEKSVTSFYKFNENVGGCFIGLKSDFLYLSNTCRYEAEKYYYTHGISMPCDLLSHRIGSLNQIFTQVAGRRPLGCCILFIGMDEEHGAMLYKVDPAGLSVPFRAVAVGNKYSEANSFLERKLKKKFPSTREEAIELALTTLSSAIGSDLKSTNIEVAEVSFNDPKFKILEEHEVETILNTIIDRS